MRIILMLPAAPERPQLPPGREWSRTTLPRQRFERAPAPSSPFALPPESRDRTLDELLSASPAHQAQRSRLARLYDDIESHFHWQIRHGQPRAVSVTAVEGSRGPSWEELARDAGEVVRRAFEAPIPVGNGVDTFRENIRQRVAAIPTNRGFLVIDATTQEQAEAGVVAVHVMVNPSAGVASVPARVSVPAEPDRNATRIARAINFGRTYGSGNRYEAFRQEIERMAEEVLGSEVGRMTSQQVPGVSPDISDALAGLLHVAGRRAHQHQTDVVTHRQENPEVPQRRWNDPGTGLVSSIPQSRLWFRYLQVIRCLETLRVTSGERQLVTRLFMRLVSEARRVDGVLLLEMEDAPLHAWTTSVLLFVRHWLSTAESSLVSISEALEQISRRWTDLLEQGLRAARPSGREAPREPFRSRFVPPELTTHGLSATDVSVGPEMEAALVAASAEWDDGLCFTCEDTFARNKAFRLRLRSETNIGFGWECLSLPAVFAGRLHSISCDIARRNIGPIFKLVLDFQAPGEDVEQIEDLPVFGEASSISIAVPWSRDPFILKLRASPVFHTESFERRISRMILTSSESLPAYAHICFVNKYFVFWLVERLLAALPSRSDNSTVQDRIRVLFEEVAAYFWAKGEDSDPLGWYQAGFPTVSDHATTCPIPAARIKPWEFKHDNVAGIMVPVPGGGFRLLKE